ncbi:unnamed protein product, partial [Amoebophrya sp. A25]
KENISPPSTTGPEAPRDGGLVAVSKSSTSIEARNEEVETLLTLYATAFFHDKHDRDEQEHQGVCDAVRQMLVDVESSSSTRATGTLLQQREGGGEASTLLCPSPTGLVSTHLQGQAQDSQTSERGREDLLHQEAHIIQLQQHCLHALFLARTMLRLSCHTDFVVTALFRLADAQTAATVLYDGIPEVKPDILVHQLLPHLGMVTFHGVYTYTTPLSGASSRSSSAFSGASASSSSTTSWSSTSGAVSGR